MTITDLLMVYLLAINLLDFVLCGADKHRARRGKWRIRERTLLGLAALGGSVGLLAGMRMFHHKTLKPAFQYGAPAILVVQLGLAVFVMSRL